MVVTVIFGILGVILLTSSIGIENLLEDMNAEIVLQIFHLTQNHHDLASQGHRSHCNHKFD